MLTTHISINDYPNFSEYCIVLHWYIFDIICSTWTNIYWSRSCSDTIDTISVDLREYSHLPFGFTLRPTPRLNFIHCTCTLLTPTFPNRFRNAHNGRISRRFPHHRTGHKYWKTPRVTINVWGFRTYIAVARSWALTNEFPSKKKFSQRYKNDNTCFGYYEQCIRFYLLTTKNIQSDVRANALSTPNYRVTRKLKN